MNCPLTHHGRIKIAVFCVAILLFLLGAVHHLGVLDYHRSPFIFGNYGDGYFNMWVMECTSQKLAQGDWNLADGKIFWPDNQGTFFWSDNLFAPNTIYGICRYLGSGPVTAFWLTTILQEIMAFMVYFLFFWMIHRICADTWPELPEGSAFFIPLFSFLACFSIGRLAFFSHFQNLSSFWLFLLFAGAIGTLRHEKRRYFLMMVFAELALLYSSPYFAVMGMCFLLVWTVFQLHLSPRSLLDHCRRNLSVLLLAMIPFFGLGLVYVRSAVGVYSPSEIRSSALRISQLWVPSAGRLADLLAPAQPSESCVYLGAGVLLAVVAVLVWQFRAVTKWLLETARMPWVWVVIAYFASVRPFGETWRGRTYWVGAVMLLSVLLLLIRAFVRHRRDWYLSLELGFLSVAGILVYGFAAGPRGLFTSYPLNPSIWGVVALFVPGATSIRAVRRMAVIGQGCVMALLLIALLYALAAVKGRRRMLVALLAALLIGLQIIEQSGLRPEMKRCSLYAERADPDEREWFSGIDGPLVVFPSLPFHRNTSPMLYFSSFADIQIMNGYSSRSTDTWDEVMRLGVRGREPTDEQLALVELAGCRYAVAWKRHMLPERIEQIRGGQRPTRFENERLMVIKLDACLH